MIVLDSNLLSEILRPSPFPRVLRWLAAREPIEVFITTITRAEVLYGVEMLPKSKRRTRLSHAIERIFADEFEGRILPFDEESARLFAKIVSSRQGMGRPISQFDAMIAAISSSRRAAVATRNSADFSDCGVRLINPWQE